MGATVDHTSEIHWTRTWSIAQKDDNYFLDNCDEATSDPYGASMSDDPLVIDLSSDSETPLDVIKNSVNEVQKPKNKTGSMAVEPAMEQLFQCPITCDTMKDPVVAADGQTYDRPAIESWLQKHRISPMTNEPLETTQVIPNIALRQLMEMFVKFKNIEDAQS